MSVAAGYEFHPAANLFPLMGEAELRDLADDIRDQGLQVPITLHEGKILDGRNRYRACELAGAEPRFVVWAGEGSPTAWVISLNAKRRHLTPSQIGCIAVEAIQLFKKEDEQIAAIRRASANHRHHPDAKPYQYGFASPAGSAVENAAKAVGVGESTVQRAKALKEHAPDLFEQVKRGERTVAEARREAAEQGRIPVRKRNPPAYRKDRNGGFVPTHRKSFAPDMEALPARQREFIEGYERGLIHELMRLYPALILPEWETVLRMIRGRVAQELTCYKLIRGGGRDEQSPSP